MSEVFEEWQERWRPKLMPIHEDLKKVATDWFLKNPEKLDVIIQAFLELMGINSILKEKKLIKK